MTSRYDWIILIGVLALTAVVASTAYRIEWHNRAAGGFLPRHSNGTMEGNEVPWRTTSPGTSSATTAPRRFPHRPSIGSPSRGSC